MDRVRESLTFSRDKNFEREAVVDERALIRDGLRRGMGEITHDQVHANLDARLASEEFQMVGRPEGVPVRQFLPPRLRLLDFLRIQPRKELSSATVQAHPSSGKDCVNIRKPQPRQALDGSKSRRKASALLTPPRSVTDDD